MDTIRKKRYDRFSLTRGGPRNVVGFQKTMEDIHDTCKKTDDRFSLARLVPSEMDFKEPAEDIQSMFEFSKRLHEKGDYYKDDNVFLDIVLREGLFLSDDDKYVKAAAVPTGQIAVYEKPTDRTIIEKQREANPNKFVDGVIRIESGNLAVCEPFDKSDDIIINGRSKAGQTFTDDEVRVEIISEGLKRTKLTGNASRCGRVVQILSRTRFKDVKHPVFLCTLGHLSNFMTPVCQTIPKIFIMGIKTDCIDMYQYDRVERCLLEPEKTNYSREERSQNIFVVVMLNWHPSRTYPLGVVIDKHTLNESNEDYLKMLDRIHGIPSFYSKATIKQTENLLEKFSDRLMSEDETNYQSVFTIDEEFSKCLDDAFSVETVVHGKKWKIGVHITDVASVIEKDSPIDKEAQTLRETQYQGNCTWKHPVHMLPEPLSKGRLSLLPNSIRQVISISFEVERRKGGFRISSPEEKISNVVSRRKFSYEEVDRILLEEDQTDPYHFHLQLLHQIATHLKFKRLGDAAEYVLSKEDNENDRSAYLRSHDLVGELMIYTNHQIAEIVLKKFEDRVPLRCQEAPSSDKLRQWEKEFQYVKDVVAALQNQTTSSKDMFPYQGRRDCKCIGVLHSNDKVPLEEMVRIRRDQWRKLEAAALAVDTEDSYSGKDYLYSLVKDDARYPYQYHVFQNWCHFQHTARYICSKHVDLKSSKARHFSLAVYPYLQFTSPLRRYMDIINHRLVHAVLNDSSPPYTAEEITTFCELGNAKRRILTKYRENIDNFPVIQKRRSAPQMYEAYISSFTSNSMQLSIPDFYGKRTGRTDLTVEIPFRFLQLKTAPTIQFIHSGIKGRNYMSCILQWEKRVYAAPGEQLEADDLLVRSSRFIPLKFWRDVIKAYLAKDFDTIREIIMKWRNIFEQCDKGDDTLLFQTIPKNDCVRKYLILDDEHREECNTRQSVHVQLGQIVGVQIEAKLHGGRETPVPQYFTFTDSLSFCIKHCMDPISYFCGYATTPTNLCYESLHHYTSTWLPIIEMESVYGAVKEVGPITIKNIRYKVNNTLSGGFSLPTEFCLCRGIDLSKADMNILPRGSNLYTQYLENQNEETASSNYLCLRCEMENNSVEPSAMSTQWIAHAKVTNIHESIVTIDGISQPERYDVRFELVCPPVGTLIGETKGAIEIIQKSIVERRMETIFRRHFLAASPLAMSIALGRDVPFLDESFVSMAMQVDKDIPATFHTMARNNEGQKKAIAKSLISSFSLIQGPPGTGKTVTGIKLLYLLNEINRVVFEEKRQIVFCGPSNKSVDHVAKWLVEKLRPHLQENQFSMVRVYGKAFVYKDFPVPSQFNFLKEGKVLKKTDMKLVESGVVLHHIIRQTHKPHSNKLREFDEKFRINPEEVALGEFMEYEKIHSEAEQAELKNYDVIFCTVSMAGNPKLLKATKGKVQQCIIDESGMCNEPETMVPVIALRPKQVILIGDHKQLQPIIKCRDAASLGMSRSLFERYQNRILRAKRSMLTLQYRMVNS